MEESIFKQKAAALLQNMVSTGESNLQGFYEI